MISMFSSTKNLFCGTCFVALMVGIAPCPSYGQAVDYGMLESTFGEPVTTSATGQPQRATDVPMTMRIITADDIRRSGAANLPDVLRRESGLSVWQWTRTTADVNVRGYNQAFSPRLLVLVNGRQIYSDAYGNTLWENLPVQLEEIRQIEIVEGPNSALFGFNAVSGVLNIITYNPLYDDVSTASVRVGTDSYRRGALVHTQKFSDDIALRISAAGTKLGEFDEFPGTLPLYSDPTNNQLTADGVVRLTDRSNLRLEVTKTGAKTTEYPYTYTPFNSKYGTNSFKSTYTADTDYGLVQANVYRNWLRLSASGGLAPVIFKNDVTVAQLEDTFKIGSNHTLRAQGEYRRNAIHDLTGAEIYYDVYAASFMWNWRIRDDLAWTNAARFDRLNLARNGPIVPNALITSNAAWDENISEVSYNSGLVWQPTDYDTFRVMTARGVQTPSLLDFGTNASVPPLAVLGNPRLKPGIINNYELAYDHNLPILDGTFRSSVFYQETKGLKSFGALLTGLVFQPDNIGTSDMVGLNLGLEGKIGADWDWDAHYTILKADDDLRVNQGGVITVPYNGAEATPTHTLNLHLGWAQGPWETDAYAQYVSEYEVLKGTGFTYTPVKLGDSINLSGRVGYQLSDNVTVSLSGQQLNHAQLRETSVVEKERQVFLTLTTDF